MSATDEEKKTPAGEASAAAPFREGGQDPLAPAIAAMDQGNLREARKLATPLTDSKEPEIRDRARALVEQMEPDRLVVGVLVGTALVLCTLVSIFVLHH
jgi:hypothetical protein